MKEEYEIARVNADKCQDLERRLELANERLRVEERLRRRKEVLEFWLKRFIGVCFVLGFGIILVLELDKVLSKRLKRDDEDE